MAPCMVHGGIRPAVRRKAARVWRRICHRAARRSTQRAHCPRASPSTQRGCGPTPDRLVSATFRAVHEHSSTACRPTSRCVAQATVAYEPTRDYPTSACSSALHEASRREASTVSTAPINPQPRSRFISSQYAAEHSLDRGTPVLRDVNWRSTGTLAADRRNGAARRNFENGGGRVWNNLAERASRTNGRVRARSPAGVARMSTLRRAQTLRTYDGFEREKWWARCVHELNSCVAEPAGSTSGVVEAYRHRARERRFRPVMRTEVVLIARALASRPKLRCSMSGNGCRRNQRSLSLGSRHYTIAHAGVFANRRPRCSAR